MRKNIDYSQLLADTQILLNTDFKLPTYVSNRQKGLLYKGQMNKPLFDGIRKNALGYVKSEYFDVPEDHEKLTKRGAYRQFTKQLEDLTYSVMRVVTNESGSKFPLYVADADGFEDFESQLKGIQLYAEKQRLLHSFPELPKLRKNGVYCTKEDQKALLDLSHLSLFSSNEKEIEVPLPIWAVDLSAPKITAQQLKLIYFVVACAIDARSQLSGKNLEALRSIKITKKALRKFLKDVSVAKIEADLQSISETDVIINANQMRSGADQVSTKLFKVADVSKKEVEISFSDAVLWHLWFEKTYAPIRLGSIHDLSSPAAISLLVNLTAIQKIRNTNRPDLINIRAEKEVIQDLHKVIGFDGLKTILKVDPNLPKSKVLTKLSGAQKMLTKSGAVQAVSSITSRTKAGDYISFDVTLRDRPAQYKSFVELELVRDLVMPSSHQLFLHPKELIDAVRYHGLEINCRNLFKFLHDEWKKFNFQNEYTARVDPRCMNTFHVFRDHIPQLVKLYHDEAAYAEHKMLCSETYRQADAWIRSIDRTDPARHKFEQQVEDQVEKAKKARYEQMYKAQDEECAENISALQKQIAELEVVRANLNAQIQQTKQSGAVSITAGEYSLAYRLREKQIAKFEREVFAFTEHVQGFNPESAEFVKLNQQKRDSVFYVEFGSRALKELDSAQEFLKNADAADLIALVENDSNPLQLDDGGFYAALEEHNQKAKQAKLADQKSRRIHAGLTEEEYQEYYDHRNNLSRLQDKIEFIECKAVNIAKRSEAEKADKLKAEEEAAAAKKEEALKKLSVLYAKEQQLAYEEADDDCYYDDDDDDDDEIIVFTNNRLERGYQEMKQEASVQPTPEVGEPIEIPDFLLTK